MQEKMARNTVMLWVLLMMMGQGMAQSFGGNPASIKWRQINSPAVKVIYPKGLDSVAARVATVSDFLSVHDSATIGARHKKISIVLQRDVNYSNAYVGLGPWRSEFFLMPPQNPFVLGTVSWADNLAVHEYRHVQQFNNFNVGLSRVMGVLGGENGRALANAGAVPDWFFEGDAVWNETMFTELGRGRLPFFLSSYKTIYRDGRTYSYMKMRNGSLRQYVPNHYELGYLLVSYGRQQYGDSVWKTVAKHAAAYKSLFYPLQGAIRKNTGLKYSNFVQQAMQDFRSRWQQQASDEPQWITPVSNTNVVNYRYPYPTADNGLVVLKSSYKQVPTFVYRDAAGHEKRIAVRDIGYDDYFSYRNGRIVYAAYQPDVRWGNRDYSIIRLLDVASGQTVSISKRTRYFSPDINEDASQLVVVKMDPGKPSLLVLMDTEGQELKSFTVQNDLVYSHPKFIDQGSAVLAAARQPNGQMGWLIWEPAANTSRWLLPLADRLVGFPVVQGDTVVYTATEGKYDGLYSINTKTGQRQLLSNYATGIYQGFVQQGHIVASYFTAGGFRLGKAVAQGTPLMPAKTGFVPLYPASSGQAFTNISQLPSRSYAAARYRKGFKPLNFHSWQPELNEPDYTFRILGNNVLNTTQTDLFYTYNTNENSHAAGVNFAYGGWYLQPVVGAKQTWGREVVYNRDTTFVYNEAEVSGGLQLPLNLSGGKHYRYLTLSSTVNYNNLRWQGIGKNLLDDQDFTYLRSRLVFTNQIQKARQHIFPRWAQSLIVDHRGMVDQHQAWQLLLSGTFYLPGLATNHNLVLTAAWQARDTLRQYAFSNSFPFSRGYNAVNYPRMWRIGANYHFPIVYPDWGFGQLVYFLRIRGNAFFDYTEGKSLRTGLTRPFRSTGGELYFDTRWWNQVPVSFGVRYSRLLDSELSGSTQPNQWEFILPVNLFR